MLNDPEIAKVPFAPLGTLGGILLLASLASLPVGALVAYLVGGVSPTAFIPGAIMTVPEWVSIWGLIVIVASLLGITLLVIERTQTRNRVRRLKRQRELEDRASHPIWYRPPPE